MRVNLLSDREKSSGDDPVFIQIGQSPRRHNRRVGEAQAPIAPRRCCPPRADLPGRRGEGPAGAPRRRSAAARRPRLGPRGWWRSNSSPGEARQRRVRRDARGAGEGGKGLFRGCVAKQRGVHSRSGDEHAEEARRPCATDVGLEQVPPPPPSAQTTRRRLRAAVKMGVEAPVEGGAPERCVGVGGAPAGSSRPLEVSTTRSGLAQTSGTPRAASGASGRSASGRAACEHSEPCRSR